MGTVRLVGNNSQTLLIKEQEFGDCCEVFIQQNKKNTKIGDSLKRQLYPSLIKLSKGMCTETPTGTLEGLKVFWVASLTNPYNTIYAGFSSNHVVLFVQCSMKNNIIYKLNFDQTKDWEETLSI